MKFPCRAPPSRPLHSETIPWNSRELATLVRRADLERQRLEWLLAEEMKVISLLFHTLNCISHRLSKLHLFSMNLDLPEGFCYLDYNATVSARFFYICLAL
jgi:hypothetical protein